MSAFFKLKWVVRFIVVTSLCFFFVGCGSSNSAQSDKDKQADQPTVNQPSNGNPSTITTGMHIYTSLCGPGGCPADERPYRVVLRVEFKRVNGWIDVFEVDTGTLGDVTLGTDTPGKYRLSKKSPQPAGIDPSQPITPVEVDVVAGTVTDAKLQFNP